MLADFIFFRVSPSSGESKNSKRGDYWIIRVENGIEFWMMLKRSAFLGGWTMKAIGYVREEFVFVLDGRMLLGRILCKRMA